MTNCVVGFIINIFKLSKIFQRCTYSVMKSFFPHKQA